MNEPTPPPSILDPMWRVEIIENKNNSCCGNLKAVNTRQPTREAAIAKAMQVFGNTVTIERCVLVK